VKWAEAERELAIRGVFLPPLPVVREYFSTPNDSLVPQIAEEPDLKEAPPQP
jgi:hypothetical protein